MLISRFIPLNLLFFKKILKFKSFLDVKNRYCCNNTTKKNAIFNLFLLNKLVNEKTNNLKKNKKIVKCIKIIGK